MPLKSDEKSVLDVLEVMALDMEIFVYFFSVWYTCNIFKNLS